jgi:ATP phosphoribosyltransferase
VLTIAVQKSGRLSEHTIKLLHECGIAFENGGHDKLKSTALNFPLQILYLRDDDIPECVADNIADAGIVGENIYYEKEKPLQIKERLGFARCRMSIAAPKSIVYKSRQDLNGLKIATSYPRILSRFLKENQINAEIHELSGSVEIAPGIGLADVIFDIVSSGSTLLSNSLCEVETVMPSEAVVIARPEPEPEKRALLDKLLFRMRSVKQAANFKYILLNAPNEKIDEISEVLPGMKSPTVTPLALPGWSSLHSVIREDDFWEIIENLKAKGAQGILVVPIEKMIL